MQPFEVKLFSLLLCLLNLEKFATTNQFPNDNQLLIGQQDSGIYQSPKREDNNLFLFKTTDPLFNYQKQFSRQQRPQRYSDFSSSNFFMQHQNQVEKKELSPSLPSNSNDYLNNNNNNSSLLFATNVVGSKVSYNDSHVERGGKVVEVKFKSMLRIHLSAIHVDKAEYPLSKLLFKLTLRLALSELSKQLEREQRIKLLLSIRSANTCSHHYAAAIAAEEYFLKRAQLFIVSGCDDAIRSVSRLASLWNVPIMTAAGFGADLNNKLVHKTLVRVAFSLKAAVEFLFKLLKSFQWKKINLIVDESDANSLALMGTIEEHLKLLEQQQHDDDDKSTTVANNHSNVEQQQQQHVVDLNIIKIDIQSLVKTNFQSSNSNNGSEQISKNFDSSRTIFIDSIDLWPNELMQRIVADTLIQCRQYSRVTILLIPQHYLRKFMLTVYDQNMANGLYTFINLPLLSSSISTSTATASEPIQSNNSSAQNYLMLNKNNNDDEQVFLWRSARSLRNSHAKKAFESLMSIYLKIPTTKTYVHFASRLNTFANIELSKKRSRTLFNTTSKEQQQLNINPYSASFYDSLQIYVTALKESLNQLKIKIQQQQQQNSSSSIELNNYFNELHLKIAELVKNRRFNNMVTGQIYINSNGDRETDYTLDDMNQMTGKFQPVILYRSEMKSIERIGRIHWSSDATIGPTNDNVDCNLTQSCASKPMTKFKFILILFGVPLVLILSSLIYFVYTRLSLESQLVDQWWKIRLSEVEIILTRRKNANNGSLVMASSTIVCGGGEGGARSGSFSTPDRQVSPKQEQQQQHKQRQQLHSALTAANLTSESGGTMSDWNQTKGTARGTATTMLIGAGGKFKTSTVVTQSNVNQMTTTITGPSDEVTQITKVTDQTNVSGWARTSSARDVCYGDITLAIYKLTKVALKPIVKFQQSRKLLIELRSIKEINHNNLCRFIGIIIDEGSWAIVSEFCPKGSLREFFHSESMAIDWTFKYSIINDILAGLTYLHSSPLGYHGRLKSSNCLVNARFVVKLSDYGPHSLFEQVQPSNWTKFLSLKSNTNSTKTLFHRQNTLDNDDDNDADVNNNYNNNSNEKDKVDKVYENDNYDQESNLLKKCIWLAPEHMFVSSSKLIGSMKGDVYSFGLLLYEIITNTMPFFDPEKNDFELPLKTLCFELKNFGPNEKTGPRADDIIVADESTNIEPLVEIMKSCWHFDSNKRPTSQVVETAIKKITRNVTSKKLLENLTTRMEQYTNNLESLVEAKLATLLEEKLKTEELLYQFVPKSIAALLKEGQFVEPEAFECVTVFYSDIVGFTSLSSESSPMEVVDFLSDLYLCFDETLEQHDIYKVDTIGDAYIVASGLPQRNDGKHVIEIACAALELRDRLRDFRIPHKPGRSLEMRVGIHSGPCVAGIVGGLNMPKYCVFGDTLTIGKFMESTGLPMKIHITEESKKLLTGINGFTIEQRKPKILRDGLPFQTYWLEKDVTNPLSIC